MMLTISTMGFAGASDSEEFACSMGDPVLTPGLGRSLEKEMAAHSSILAQKSHGQRSLAGYRPWSCRESDTSE